MDKEKKLKNLICALTSQMEFIKYLDGRKRYDDISKNELDQITSVILCLFFTIIIDKYFTRKNGDIIGCALNDDFLDEMVDLIVTHNADGYCVGDLIYKDPLTVIVKVRNKFAHGDYIVDNGYIIFYENELQGKIEINSLASFVYNFIFDGKYFLGYDEFKKSGLISQKPLNNKNSANSNLSKDRQMPDQVYSLTDLNVLCDNLYVANICAKPINGVNVNYEYCIELKENVDYVFNVLTKLNSFTILKSRTKKNKKGVNFSFELGNTCFSASVEPLSNKNYYKYIQRDYENNKELYKEQSNIQGNNSVRIGFMVTNYENKYSFLEQAIFINLVIVLLLRNDLVYSFDEDVDYVKNYITFNKNLLLAVNYLFNFYSIFQYGFEADYTRNGLDCISSIIDGNTLDLTKLNLDCLSDKLENNEREYSGFTSDIPKLEDKLLEIKNDIVENQSKIDNIHPKAVENYLPILEKERKNLQLIKNDLEYKIEQSKNPTIDVKLFIKNANIIAHVRNAISHGYITIEKSTYVKKFDDMILIIDDYDNDGVLVYHKKIKVSDFITIFSDSNKQVILDFYNNSLNNIVAQKKVLKK